MKTVERMVWVVVFVTLVLSPAASYGALEDEMKYLGYSNEITDYTKENLAKTHSIAPGKENPLGEPAVSPEMKEANAVQEQLTELGRTRSLTPETPLSVEEARGKLETFWKDMAPVTPPTAPLMSDEQKAFLKDRLTRALMDNGYEVTQMDLIDMPANLGNPQVRAVIRAIRPLKSKDEYREIRNNLGQIKDLGIQAATIDGVLYLSELTTFFAENPRNKYYYAKTILNP
jgi:hypothetical protein